VPAFASATCTTRNPLHGCDVLEGEVLDLSDSGLDPAVYAVIRVERLDRPVVVPVERLFDPRKSGGR
jgi:hypothetical protein